MEEQEVQKVIRIWSQYVSARHALEVGGYIRSFKQPQADFAEWFIAWIFRGEIVPNKCNPWYDVIASDKRIQVKSLAKASTNQTGYIISSKDRANDPKTGASHYAFVFFEDLIPSAVYLAPEIFVRTFEKKQIKRSDLDRAIYEIEVDLSVLEFDPL